MLDLLDWMSESTKYRSRIDDIFSIFFKRGRKFTIFHFLLSS